MTISLTRKEADFLRRAIFAECCSISVEGVIPIDAHERTPLRDEYSEELTALANVYDKLFNATYRIR